MRYHLVFDHLVWKFISIYPALTNSDEQQHHFFVVAIVTGEFTMLILRKYGFKVSVISFGFYSTYYKFYIHLPSINTQRWTTAPFNTTDVISSSNRRTLILYQASDDCCEWDCNSDIIRLLQPSLTINYCKQSVLAIVTDLNMFVWSIKIFISFREAPWYSSFLLRARYLYNSTGLRFYIFGLLPESHLCDRHSHGWAQYIATTKIRF